VGTNTQLAEAGYVDTQQIPFEAASRQTRRVYDLVAPLYPLSSWLFHSQAHRAALRASEIQNGTNVLEVATGSGEMLDRLAKANPDGHTVGVDLSPKMAARSQVITRDRHPGTQIHCPAADVRWLPFASGSFDTVICCFLFELLPEGEMGNSLEELSRVLRPGGRLVTTLVGQNRSSFNAMYKVCNKVAPAFWGRQVGEQVAGLLDAHGYTIDQDHHVRQIYYSSRIIAATRSTSNYGRH
jgi:ubiquinone/menaquinone biosynthesis C-methylase UbiE